MGQYFLFSNEKLKHLSINIDVMDNYKIGVDKFLDE